MHQTVRVLLLGFALTSILLVCASVDAQAASTLQVDGKVVDEAGRPVADAVVFLRQAPSLFDSLVGTLGEDADDEPSGPVIDEAKTDAAGIYRLGAGGPGLYRVTVEAAGRASQEVALEPLVASRTLEPVKLQPSVPVEVTVTAGGKPVADALVAVAAQLTPPTEWATRTRVVRTEETGRAELVWPQGERRLVMVAAPGWLPSYQEMPPSRSTRIEVALEAGEAETLRLQNAEGRPLGGLVVALGRGRHPVGRSGEDGRLVVRLPARAGDGGAGQSAAEMELRVLGPEGRYLRRQVAAVPEPELMLEIPEPRPVDGRIFDQESREPVADALVWAYARSSDAARTDSDGRFRIHALEGVPIYWAGAPGYQTQRGGVDEAGAGLGLQPIRAIVGRVLDRRGVGVEGAEVVAEPDVLEARSSDRLMELVQSRSRDFTDAEGRFRLDGLLADAGYDIEARRSGYAETSKRVVFAPDEPGERRVELVLDPGRFGIGLVVDESDRPVVGAEVGLYEPPGAMPRVRSGPPKEPTPIARAITGAAGEFRLADLGEGSFHLKVVANGFAPLTVPGVEIGPTSGDGDGDGGGDGPDIDLGVAVLAQGAEIRGRVVDADDKPVAGAQIFSEISATFPGEGMPPLPEAVGDLEGRFVIEGLTPGVARRVVARAEGFIEGEILGVTPSRSDRDEIVIVLQAPSTIRGRVVGPGGEPILGAMIVAGLVRDVGTSSSYRSLSAARSDDSGAFELSAMPPGQIQLRIRAEGYRSTEGHMVPVLPGKNVDDLVIQLEAGAVLAGRVIDAEGNPIPRASISSSQPELGQAGRGPYTESAADGTFRLDGMPPGESKVAVYHETQGVAVETVDLQLGQEDYLEIRLAGATVSGQVVTATGEVAAGATVDLRRVDPEEVWKMRHSVLQVTTRSDGTFELESVPEGTWMVVAEQVEHGVAYSDEFEAAGTPIADLYLQLQTYVSLTGEIRGVDFEQLAETKILAVSPAGQRVGEVRHDGTYRVGRLSPGEWAVVADAGTRQVTESVAIELGMTDPTLDIDFGGGRALEGVVLIDGIPVDGAEVTCQGGSQTTRVARTDHRGRFLLEGLGEGSGQLLVTHLRSSLRYRTEIQLARDEPLVLDIRTSSIFGRVVDSAGSPVGAATIVLEEAESDSADDESTILRRIRDPQPEVTDARGEFRFGGLTEGAWRLRAEKDGFETSEQTLSLQGGSELGPLTFVLGPAGAGDSR